MGAQRQEPAADSGAAAGPIKVGGRPLFSTWVYVCDDGPKHLNARLEQLTRTLMQDERDAAYRTNADGWHYAFDVFKLEEPVVAEFHDVMTQHVQAFPNHFRPPERKKKDRFRLQAGST